MYPLGGSFPGSSTASLPQRPIQELVTLSRNSRNAGTRELNIAGAKWRESAIVPSILIALSVYFLNATRFPRKLFVRIENIPSNREKNVPKDKGDPQKIACVVACVATTARATPVPH